jgi:hypothetical protein
VERDGELIGFLLLLASGEALIPDYCGLDYEWSLRSGAYFNMFYEAVRIGIERGFREMDFGITTLAPKLDLGCEVEPLSMYMRNRGRLGGLLPRLFDGMTPSTEMVKRHVFKD